MRTTTQLYTDAYTSRADMIKLIMDAHKNDIKKPTTLKTQLGALWNLAFSIGRELGTIEGYKMAQDGQPFGQVAHVN